MLQVVVLGAGRIGTIHAGNVATHAGSRLRGVYDVNTEAAARLAGAHGARSYRSVDEVFADTALDAVVIASSTDTHVELLLRAAAAGTPVFCEKPIANDLALVDRAVAAVRGAGVPCLIAFNRRFDPSFARLQQALRDGAIGPLELCTITSRDPEPPPVAYVKVSGGIFRDMMIHDLDMARWLLGEEPVEVYATGSSLVDPAIGLAGDVDTAAVLLKTARGAICQISNSRRASYGYDQRLEVHGRLGMLQAGNLLESTVARFGGDGVVAGKPLHFFLERYAEAYRREWDHFVGALQQGRAPSPGVDDGRAALVLAEAAQRSLQTGRTVRVDEI
jgi:myo-inositol 2-dehydrogenase/D-chiro-inositol 1-dehydrogenase